MSEFKVLVVGGYGNFGARLVEMLAASDGVTPLVAGRSMDKAQALVRRLGLPQEAVVVFDRPADNAKLLARLKPQLLIDVSGPFQAYGDKPYQLAEACISCGINYLDLADATGFVAGIDALDERARKAGVFVLSGCSTYPAVSGAVVRHVSEGWDKLEACNSMLGPSPKVAMGRNVIEAILSYAGERLEPDGSTGLMTARPGIIRPAGVVPIGPLTGVAVDVPDRAVLQRAYPDLREVGAFVATRPQVMLHMLRLVAWLRSKRLLPRLGKLAALVSWGQGAFNWGEHRGGMAMEMIGIKAGMPVSCRFDLIAEGHDGPYIPVLAALCIVRDCLARRAPEAGARSALGAVSFASLEPLLAARRMTWSFRDLPSSGTPYERVLGAAYERLTPPVRQLHRFERQARWRGIASVRRGTSWPARLLAAIFRFPPAAASTPVEVTLTRDESGVETWQRNFNGAVFHSLQEEGKGRYEGVLVERFGPLSFGMAVVVTAQGELELVLRNWDAFGVPMPNVLLPRVKAREHDADDRFNFEVEMALPWGGLIVRYEGWLELVA
ncbi:MAG: DUF4166 domain-containing protein [Anderseniella sp.]|nr:DUF4166 domain-containing protein [Anderseniella sp.]